MKKFYSVLSLLVAVFLFSSNAFSQYVTATGFTSRSLTQYTNGATNDSIYFYCSGSLGSLTATPLSGAAPWDFAWQSFDVASNAYVSFATQNNQATSTISNLAPGGYRVTITDNNGVIVGCERAWISQVLTTGSVTVSPIPPGCGSVSLNGQITYPTASPYYNPPPDPMIINDATQISVCFTGNHTFVSDLGFYLVGPASCGSPTVVLSPNPGTNCNGGENINNLCFTDQATPNFNVCTATTPLTGSYDSYGAASTPINWAAINGCSANASGWRVQIYDCIGADIGNLTDATITFTGQDACGQPQTIIYSTPAGFNSPINDNSCSAASASVFQVPETSSAAVPYTNTYQWTSNPVIAITGATSTLTPSVNPGPTVNTTFTLTMTGNGPLNICGGQLSDSEVFVYNVPAAPVIVPVSGPVCQGSGNIDLDLQDAGGGPYTGPVGTWTGPGIVNATTGIFNPSAAGVPGVKTITYTINVNGCVVTATTQITVLSSGNATINDPGAICTTQGIVDLSAVTNTGGTWSGPGIISASSGFFDPSGLTPGVYTITYNIPNGCVSTDTIELSVVGPGTSSATPITGQICTTDPVITLSGSPAGGTWSGPGIVSGLGGLWSPSIAGAGTFTLTYSFANCVSPSTISVTVTQSVNSAITPVATLCADAAPITLTAATAGGVWSGPGITNASAGTFSPAAAGPGTHTITYTISNACGGTSTTTITVVANQNAQITNPGDLCDSGAPIVSVGSPAGGQWSGTGITNATTGAFSPAVSGAGTFPITYSFPNNNCIAPATIDYIVLPTNTGTISGPPTVCENGAPISITNTATGGQWSGVGVDNNGVFDPAIAGVGDATLLYTIPNTCNGNLSLTIEVLASPVAVLSGPASVCSSGNTVTYSSNVAGTWSGTSITSGGQFNPATSPLGTVTLTFTPSNACSAVQTIEVLVSDQVDATIADVPNACQSEGIVQLVAATPGGTWSGQGVNAVTGEFNPAIVSAGFITITYTITGVCSGSDTQVIEVGEAVDATITNVNPVCETVAPFQLNAASSGGTWSGTGVNASGLFNPGLAQQGTFTITYTINDICSDTDDVTITVADEVDATITDIAGLCSNASPVTLQAADAGGVWSGSGVNPSSGLFDPSLPTPGNVVITYTISGVCSDSDQTTIFVEAQPSVSVTPINNVCITAAPVNLSATPAGGVWTGSAGISGTTFNPAFAGAGTYTLTYTVGTVCPGSASDQVTVFAIPNVNAGVDQALCAGESTSLSASGANSYSWSGQGLGSPSSATTSAQPNFTTTYTVTGTDANGCQDTDQITVVVNPLPSVGVGESTLTICEGDSAQLFASGLSNYNWSPSTFVDDTESSTPMVYPNSTTTYTVSGTDSNGCPGSAQVTVNVTEIEILIDANPAFGSIPLTTTLSLLSNGTEFEWDFDEDGLIDTTTFDPSAAIIYTFENYNNGGQLVTVIATDGTCFNEDSFNIQLFLGPSAVTVYNVVTPNGDGKNDIYYVKGNGITDFKMDIYNRNGTLIETLEDLDEINLPTDGFDRWTPEGGDGTFFYYMNAKGYDGKTFQQQGTITVLGIGQ